MSIRGQDYISSYTLRATQQTMNVISTVLRFDVVELWKNEGGNYVCVYIHTEDSARRSNSSIITADTFYPNDGRKHVLSPRICDIAKMSSSRYHWRVADPSVTGRNGKPALYPDHPASYQTEMGYRVDCGATGLDIYIVGFSLSNIPFTSSRLKFLTGVSYAIYIAAFDLDDGSSPDAPGEAAAANPVVDPVRRRELDAVTMGINSIALTAEPDSDKKFVYPVSDIPLNRPVPLISFNDVKGIRHLADGSHSNVFAGTLGRDKVVVKMIKEESLNNPVAKHEYDVELALLSRMDHSNIVRLIGHGTHPRKFLVLEYLGGGILSSILETNEMKSGSIKMFHKPTFTYQMLLVRARELATAMHYLHHGVKDGVTIIHRDLKPDNIGFTEDGALKIIDFGLCTCVKVRRRSDIFYEMTGNTGSLRYMAPEVANRKPYGEKVDVHSFGIILWQMARDKVPFDGMDANEFLTSVVRNKERPKLDKSWPVEFSNLLVSCWHHNPTARPSFREIVLVLDGLLGLPATALNGSVGGVGGSGHNSDSGVVPSPPGAASSSAPATVRKGQSGWF
jgi:hypothetical protein